MSLRLVHSAAEIQEDLAVEEVRIDRAPRGFSVMNRRLLPGSGKVVDHIFVGPPGVYVVDHKRMTGAVTVRAGRVFVNGLARDGMIRPIQRAAVALERLLRIEFGDAKIPLTAALSVVGAELPRRACVEGVRILSPRSVKRLLRHAPAALTRRDVETVTDLVIARLPLA